MNMTCELCELEYKDVKRLRDLSVNISILWYWHHASDCNTDALAHCTQ